MATVIRDARIEGQALVLGIGGVVTPFPARPANAAASRPQAAPSSTSALPSASAPPSASARPLAKAEPADLASLETQLRRALASERGDVFEQAREAGHAAGAAQGRAEWDQRVAELEHLLVSLRERFGAGVAQAEDVIVEIAFETITRMLGSAAPAREGVIALVREALAQVHERERLVLRLAPADVAVIESVRAELAESAGLAGLDLVADERIELGGCLVETAGGGLDARLETQLQRLRDVLIAARTGTLGAVS